MTSRDVRHCAICGSTERVEANHVGGRNHLAWFTSPLCGKHHDRFHVLLRQAGVDLEFTKNPILRTLRVLKAMRVLDWMVIEYAQEQTQTNKEKN